LGGPRPNTMVKGKAMTPVPHGVISTSTGPVDPVDEAIIAADAEEATEEYLPDEVVEE
jgi:hypothetical protein